MPYVKKGEMVYKYHRKKSLGVVLESQCVYDGKNYASSITAYLFITQLLLLFKEVTIYTPVKRIKTIDYKKYNISFKKKGIKIVRFPYWRDTREFLKLFPFRWLEILKISQKAVRSHDILWIRYPSIVSLIIFLFAGIYHRPLIIHVVGNLRKALEKNKYSRICLPLIETVASLIQKIPNFLWGRKVILTTGIELFKLYSHCSPKILVDSVISKKTIFFRKDTCFHKTKVILYVGALLDRKGVSYLLKSLPSLLKQNNRLKLFIIGKGKEEENLRRETEILNIENSVRFLGYIPFGKRLYQIYKMADVFVLPSLSEGIPRVILEAWALGIPVVATKVGGIPYLIRNGENGILVPPCSPDALSKAIKKIIDNKTLRKKLIKGGYHSVKEYTIEKQIHKLKGILLETSLL